MVPGGVPFPMLSDAGGRIGNIYGVYDEEAGVDIRGRFLIDPDGVIQAMETVTPPVGRNVSELIRQVKAFQHVRATGEVTPSGWQPGKPTLKPGPEWSVRYGKSGNRRWLFEFRKIDLWILNDADRNPPIQTYFWPQGFKKHEGEGNYSQRT